MKVRTFNFLSTAFLLSLALAACGGKPSTEGSETKPSTGPSDDLYSIAGLKRDNLIDEDVGGPLFDEEVDITFWSVIGNPDLQVFDQLVSEFNEIYAGQIHLSKRDIGHFDYYTTLDNAWINERDQFPDLMLFHNEKTIEYAKKGYTYCLDEIPEIIDLDMGFNNLFENIDRVTKYNGHRFGVPIDAHGFITNIRQDIIKKNNLGWDNNTRFIPQSYDEYDGLLKEARRLADAGELWVRNVSKMSKAADANLHAWKKANPATFYPEFTQSTDPDGLSALYANGGTLLDSAQDEVTFQNNKGFVQYCKDVAYRGVNRLMGDGGKTHVELFSVGDCILFPEGPWYASMNYEPDYNNVDMSRTSIKIGGVDVPTGITEEDAQDPIYSHPYVASHPLNWWTLPENMSDENNNKWYGNGHVLTVSKTVTSMQKVAACMVFANWLTQGINEDTGDYNLVKHCKSGHIPAYKNVYESDGYVAAAATNTTLKALGNPADIIACEGLEYETTVFGAVGGSVQNAINLCYSTPDLWSDQAVVDSINQMAESTQQSLDLLKSLDI